jgi:hypothetical protein
LGIIRNSPTPLRRIVPLVDVGPGSKETGRLDARMPGSALKAQANVLGACLEDRLIWRKPELIAGSARHEPGRVPVRRRLKPERGRIQDADRILGRGRRDGATRQAGDGKPKSEFHVETDYPKTHPKQNGLQALKKSLSH